jgi:ABC-type spermidine/putrescine transport system permease subunit I
VVEWGLLVSIFIVQEFDFADWELGAAATLLFNLVLLVTLRAMLAEERRRERVGEVATAPPSVVATAEPAPVG